MAPHPHTEYQPIWSPTVYTPPTSFTVTDSYLHRNRMKYWSNRFDQIAISHHVSSSQGRHKNRQQQGSEYSRNSSRSSSRISTPLSSRRASITDLSSPGFVHVLDVKYYTPSEVDITLPETGKLLVKGKKFGGEFEEVLDLPENVDDEEISLDVNSSGKLVVRAPYL